MWVSNNITGLYAWFVKSDILEVARQASITLAGNQRVTPPNLASIIMLAENGGKPILLTGDADDPSIVAGLKASDRLDANGQILVDVFKIPHHGAHNSFSNSLTQAVVAKDYVFCGNGKNSNPEPDIIAGYLEVLLEGHDGKPPALPTGVKPTFWFNDGPNLESGKLKKHWEGVEDTLKNWHDKHPGRFRHKLMKSDIELSTLMADTDVDQIDRLAASRILSTRNFVLSPDIRAQMLAASREGTSVLGYQLADIERLLRYRSESSIALSKGGGEQQPLTEQSEVQPDINMPYQRKLAVVIGVSDYEDLPPREQEDLPLGSLTDLSFAEADAAEIERLLRSGRLGTGWEIEILTGRRANLAEAERVLDVFEQEARPDDLVVFFFSGHGVEDAITDDRTFFFLQDSHLEDLQNTGLSFAHVRDWALNLQSRHVLLLIDACRSGTIGSSKGEWDSVDYDVLDDRRSAQSGGKIALTSSMGEQLSYEWSSRGLGYFTATLSDALEGRVANFANDKLIEVDELYAALLEHVPDRTGKSRGARTQIPGYVLLDGSDLLRFPVALNF